MPQTLYDYLQQTQRFLRDQNQTLENPDDLISYVNRARRTVAEQSSCIRVLTPISGGITSITVDDGGSGYTDPTVTIAAPDSAGGRPTNPAGAQATAEATVSGGVITDIQVTNGGDGYFQPGITITDDDGSGASATANISGINVTVANQERYDFADVDLSGSPGVESVLSVRSISIIYSNYRYSLPMYSFSIYQARIRNYPTQYLYVPTFSSQYGRGVNGTLYLYPIPDGEYQQEWDAFCLPSDLVDDSSVEALADPWTDAVPFLAAYYAYQELQNWNASRWMMDQYTHWMQVHSAAAMPGRMSNPNGGRW